MRSGARSLAAAVGREHDVAWDRIDDGAAHGVAATYHEVLVAGHGRALRLGSIDRVVASGADGGVLRGTLVRS